MPVVITVSPAPRDRQVASRFRPSVTLRRKMISASSCAPTKRRMAVRDASTAWVAARPKRWNVRPWQAGNSS
jgi:hypothetical protein